MCSSRNYAKWLKDHPGVEVISRDRARAYEKGVNAGAPQAIQLADRFHLLQNLALALEAVLSDHSADLKIVAEAIAPVLRPDGSQKKGYRGSYCTVTRYAQRIRFSQGLAPRQRLSNCSLPEVIEPEKKPLTVRRATWLVLRRPENRDEQDKQLLARLIAQNLDLAQAIELSQDFAQIVRARPNN